MFAVTYRGFIYPHQEKAYEQAWHCIAEYFIQHWGALGSALHKSAKGEYIAYSRWPDQARRDAVWGENAKPLPDDIQQVISTLKTCIDFNKTYEEIAMSVVDDLFLIKAG